MKRILGLDLGTNSIGWAVVRDEDGVLLIEQAGSRIIPMDADVLGDFDKGNSVSQTAERTRLRGVRRLIERCVLRRERLHRVLRILNFLPGHYLSQIDFERCKGKFFVGMEPKLAWTKDAAGKAVFLFQRSFEEMLDDFARNQPLLVENGKKVPYDWTIYYLRKKALSREISKEELAWIILNFNQKRGYYQLRGEEEEESADKNVEYKALRVDRVEVDGEKGNGEKWYSVYLGNGWVYKRSSRVALDGWVGQVREFIVTTSVNEDGSPKVDKDGVVKRSFRAPKEDDWMLMKKKTEHDVDESGKTVGCYIYDTLLQKPQQKIRGKLIRTIERKYYKEELRQILEVQRRFHPELEDRVLYKECVEMLYPNNEAHRNDVCNGDFVSLLIDDVIFYQRPLKSKKSEIGNCPYERNAYVDQTTGELKVASLKCITKSHPLFQEFRLWQFLSNLKVYKREMYVDGRLQMDVDVTGELLKGEEDYTRLFKWLNERENVDQKSLLKYPPFGLKKQVDEYRWNYVEDRVYPCNETRHVMKSRLERLGILEFPEEMEEKLWHILYSVTDQRELETALGTFAEKWNLPRERFVEAFRRIPSFKKEYGAYSAKALKKLLPLMRRGEFWDETLIDEGTRERIDGIIRGEWEGIVPAKVREKLAFLKKKEDFRGLPVWLACYVVYGRHSEGEEVTKWESPDDIDVWLNNFKQHSLRNPIVEQVVLETLRVVRDIWRRWGNIDEIHVELGRKMKNPADERKNMTMQSLENENTNLRIKALLAEFLNPEYGIENVRPYSPSQQEILRIYEEAVLNDPKNEIPEDIARFLKETKGVKQPSKSEFMRYKLWLEQKYCSPYTGAIIPLGKLFTPAYEIEHVIPQSRYFDDSYSNKVICEAEVNKLKSNQLGYEFIKNHHGEKVEIGFGKEVEIFSEEKYETFVKEHYGARRLQGKMKKLLMDDIPESFIERQLNDSRYISKVVKGLLSNVVREKNVDGGYEPEAISKNVIVCTGDVTDRLKRDWGVTDVWNQIITPRFERLNRLTGSERFGHWECKGGKQVFQIEVPLENQKGFSKKRIDHRHHAMDAIVIACATRNHVNYLNNESARKGSKISRFDLQRLLCDKCKVDAKGNYHWILKKPWETFTQDVRVALEGIIVSFKQNLRVINKSSNYYWCRDASGKKVLKKQVLGDNWAIRKSMHKDTVFGRVNLRMKKDVRLAVALEKPEMIVDKRLKHEIYRLCTQYNSYKTNKKLLEKYLKEHATEWKDIDFAKVKVYYYTDDIERQRLVATRKPLDTSFDKKKIESITDTGIQKILLNHLEANNGDSNLAFSPEGIEEMNERLMELNGGKAHQPIYRVRVSEPLGSKFQVGETGNKVSKYVEADKGTNLFFAIYEAEDGKRVYETIPLNIVVEREKQGNKPVPERNGNGCKLLFWLSPNDLVYLPTEEDLERGKVDVVDVSRIYKMVSATGTQCLFVPYYVANVIVPALELEAQNKIERAWTGEMIKSICVPMRVDRLGNILRIDL